MVDETNDILTPEVMMKWAASHNAHQIVSFHNEIKRLMRNELVWLNNELKIETDKFKITQYENQKNIYLESFSEKLKINTFLMLYSHLEEWLTHLYRKQFPESKPQKNSLQRFQPIVSEKLKVTPVDLKNWHFLLNCGDLRNCLLHANGRVDLLKKQKDQEKLKLFCLEEKELLISRNYVKLANGFLKKFQNSIDKQIDELL